MTGALALAKLTINYKWYLHRQDRLEWCRARSTRNCADWERIVFKDKSYFKLCPDDNHRRVWRSPGGRHHLSPTPQFRHGTGGERNILQSLALVVSAAPAHKTFGSTDLTSTYSVCTWRVFGGIGHRTHSYCQWSNGEHLGTPTKLGFGPPRAWATRHVGGVRYATEYDSLIVKTRPEGPTDSSKSCLHQLSVLARFFRLSASAWCKPRPLGGDSVRNVRGGGVKRRPWRLAVGSLRRCEELIACSLAATTRWMAEVITGLLKSSSPTLPGAISFYCRTPSLSIDKKLQIDDAGTIDVWRHLKKEVVISRVIVVLRSCLHRQSDLRSSSKSLKMLIDVVKKSESNFANHHAELYLEDCGISLRRDAIDYQRT
ncbi:uncharacterized protein TNCV_1287941 [Trichonephila clavipes]|nr:uncharacterized protein TNCV_1287941 [Trichonephila clavipes]